MPLDLVINDLYSSKMLEDEGLKLFKFYPQNSFYIDKNLNIYHFKHISFSKLKIRFQYHQKIELPDRDINTPFDNEYDMDELMDCCSSLRLGIDYKNNR